MEQIVCIRIYIRCTPSRVIIRRHKRLQSRPSTKAESLYTGAKTVGLVIETFLATCKEITPVA